MCRLVRLGTGDISVPSMPYSESNGAACSERQLPAHPFGATRPTLTCRSSLAGFPRRYAQRQRLRRLIGRCLLAHQCLDATNEIGVILLFAPVQKIVGICACAKAQLVIGRVSCLPDDVGHNFGGGWI